MTLKPLGPDGVQSRIDAIQRRIQERTGRPAQNPDGASDGPSPLQGVIGSTGSIGGSVRPFNPFGDGASVEPKPTPSQLSPLIQKAATEAGVAPSLLDALVATESAYDPSARSRAGALGLSQLMPGTARELGVENPFDPAQNLRGGATYLAQMMDRFGGDARLALAAYNAGPGAVEKFGGIPPYRETQRYVDRVMSLFQARKNA